MYINIYVHMYTHNVCATHDTIVYHSVSRPQGKLAFVFKSYDVSQRFMICLETSHGVCGIMCLLCYSRANKHGIAYH